MHARKNNKMMLYFFFFLFLSISSGCATNIQVMKLEKEIKELKGIVQKVIKEEKNRNKLFMQIAKRAEAATARAEAASARMEAAAVKNEEAASRAESAAVRAERSVEIFLYEEKVKAP